MNRYKPGQGFRITLVATSLQVYTDPSNSLVVLALPGPSGSVRDGTEITGSPVKDSTGNWHCDFTIPLDCPPGIGAYRWLSSGGTAVQDANSEKRIQVVALDFAA